MEQSAVFVNGCFDILHPGHIRLLKFAKSHGSKLIVGIDSDARVKAMKGNSRPINDQYFRKEMLLSIRYVDDVIIYDSELELRSLIKKVKPLIMVVGSDWRDKAIIGSEFANKIVFFDRIENYASTKIIKNIIDRN
jgi:D-beta-D-heptose 7-phosphate kinase/D-beta-D-heptose 1-phosphate adenosyltransferase